MTRSRGRPLRGVCEALRTVLLQHVPLTRFQLDLIVSQDVRETFVLVDPASSNDAPPGAAQSRATVIVPIKDEAGPIGTLTLEHRLLARSEPRLLQEEIESVALAYAPVLRACLGRGRRAFRTALEPPRMVPSVMRGGSTRQR